MLINADIIGSMGAVDVIDVGSGTVADGYYMDSSCTVPATVAAIVSMDSPTVYRKMIPYIPAWSTGTADEIVAAVQASDAGLVDLTRYWSVGDTRTVSLSAMAATGVGESHVAQDVEIVLMDAQGLYTAEDGSKTTFVWGLKDGLIEKGYMNSTATNSGHWKECARRIWCNSVFWNSLPEYMRSITKTANVKVGSTYYGFEITQDKCFFPSLTEVRNLGDTDYTQFGYYNTESNRMKKNGASGSAYYWWCRDHYTGNSTSFIAMNGSGSGYTNASAELAFIVAPHGCI